MEKRLNDLLPGEEAVIMKIEKKSVFRKRLMEMGIRKGSKVLMRRDAPMGDPMEINVMGYNISLRKSEAMYIIIDEAQ
jgi:ferrous iron transport protein A